MVVALVGQYYNAATPFASGGQPVQVYYMSRFGVSAGNSSSVLIIKFYVPGNTKVDSSSLYSGIYI